MAAVLPTPTTGSSLPGLARALVQAVRDDCRATRARRLMRNVLELSADQTAYTRWVPLGAARYELIADAYALDAASEVRQP